MVGRKFLGMRFPRARDLGPILVVWAASMSCLVFQRDLGTALLYFGLFLVMLYVATGPLELDRARARPLPRRRARREPDSSSYVNGRFDAWLDAFNPDDTTTPTAAATSSCRASSASPTAGSSAPGLGQGRPDITPLAQSDYIIASLGEELGLVGLFAILALYLLFVSRGFRIGFAGQDDFGTLLGVGLSFVIALQVFVVIGGVTRVIPLTGLTTPFLAAGGSSLVANWIIVALLLRLSDTVRRPAAGSA